MVMNERHQENHLHFFSISLVGSREGAGVSPSCIWAEAEHTSGWVASLIQAFRDSVPCSRVLQWCSEGVLEPQPSTSAP